ncbi:glycoside-pentoside-hexuronide (GPH):cation symporter [Bombilactobacillus folatiphilus]|uniref:Glycoside-pentoside-hexuronide (GPH):cation symporter n=1 Tax=Bombilactobacillus folatiphilus TaxID=2923362 RepID=A0ABY4P8T2_9LACO|nr:glycoside-pentoside-hexuronide (GPH):cation symporter [Bombilactobacillus folatiphilus]UQS82000.1 glycoside-pentoside-hexuronide (GPH):cation symporter [Bombilactobacillus folatiphilus]
MAKFKTRVSYMLGTFGHDFFAAAMLNYFIMFITNHLFITSNNKFNNQMIGLITTTMVVIRIAELFIDPFIGNMVDNTHTRWGKFKPWVITGAIVSGLALAMLYTTLGGLATSHPMLYIVAFAVIYIVMDVFYSFKDIGIWSMVPALTLDSSERDTISTWGRLGSTIGGNLVTLAVVPIALFFSVHYNGGQGDRRGWLAFGIVTALLSILGALIIGLGTKEQSTPLRENKQKTSTKDVFKILFQNDQLMWTAVAHFFFAMGWDLVNSLLLYYFTFILGNSSKFALYGTVNFIVGMISVSLFPALAHRFQRRKVFLVGISVMMVGIFLLFFADFSTPFVIFSAALAAAPQPLLFLVIMLTMTDTIEYGQLKLHHRDESLVLSVRPLVDKLASAIVNGLVSIIVIATHMSGNAKVSSITNGDSVQFKMYMLAVPIILLLCSLFVYLRKVKITEAKHAQIVTELEASWGQEYADTKSTVTQATPVDQLTYTAPVAGQLQLLEQVGDPTFAGGKMGKGVAIIPQNDHQIVAPISGIVQLLLPTKHAVGILADNGLVTLIHVGIDTVQLRGRGFELLVERGQRVERGELLLNFDVQVIQQAGLADDVLMTIINSNELTKFEILAADQQFVQAKEPLVQVDK